MYGKPLRKTNFPTDIPGTPPRLLLNNNTSVEINWLCINKVWDSSSIAGLDNLKALIYQG